MEIEINNHVQKSGNEQKTDSIPVLELHESYNTFFENFMLPNLPCVIKDATLDWESTRYWITNNKPNFNYLSQKYGTSDVTVYNCFEKYYNSQKTNVITLDEYITYWKCLKHDKDLQYLKDWHLKLNYPDDNFYTVPKYFASDWLNEYFVECKTDDYRFVYMGPKNTWTPFHADVFNSFSWSSNLCGKKKWLFFPPGEENKLRDELNNLPYDVTTIDTNTKSIELIQNAGEAVFVPSGWYHQVYNLEDTISINHNWVNGCNIKSMWNALQDHLTSVKKELDDCKDMDNFSSHCQVMLNASFGIDYYTFYDFLKHITLKRFQYLEKPTVMYNNFILGKNHVLFDLKAVQEVLECFINCDEVKNLSYFDDVDIKPKELLLNIFEKT